MLAGRDCWLLQTETSPCPLSPPGLPRLVSLPAHLTSPCFFSGLIPHLLGDVVFLWGCNLLAHFINAYLVDDSVSDTPGGLGNDQNPGSQVGWNKGLPFFLRADAQRLGQAGTLGFSLPGDSRAPNCPWRWGAEVTLTPA